MPDKQVQFFEHHLSDLINRTFQSGYPVFTDFMTSREFAVFQRISRSTTEVAVSSWGGHEDCERQIGGFFPLDFPGEWRTFFPIVCIVVSVRNKKYAGQLCHRDYLGAILNLGIQRSIIGDIRIHQGTAYVFCKEEFASFVVENFSTVGHTSVECEIVADPSEIPAQEYIISERSVASPRLDCIVAAMTGLSRNKASALISQGSVIADHEPRNSVSFMCRDEMMFTIRGYGKYRLSFAENDYTRKGKQKVTIYKYK